MRYRFNYWMVIFHFLVFELELLMSLVLVFGLMSYGSNSLVSLLLSLLFVELLLQLVYAYLYLSLGILK